MKPIILRNTGYRYMPLRFCEFVRGNATRILGREYDRESRQDTDILEKEYKRYLMDCMSIGFSDNQPTNKHKEERR